jgi:plastocyanin
MRRRAIPLLAIAAALTLALAACGGGSSSSSGETAAAPATTSTGSSGTATVLQLRADPDGALSFDRTTLEAPAGTVTIEMTNDSSVPHNISIQGNGVDVTGDTVSDGGTSTVTADLQPGTYTFLCTVDSHAADGMQGTLTVQ